MSRDLGGIIIRDATEADLAAILEIFNATIPGHMVTAELEPVSVEDRLDWFREHSPDRQPFWVIELEGKIAAWLSFQPFMTRAAYGGSAEISVYVAEAFRRRGLARRLVEEAIGRSPALGIHSLVGWIFGHNKPSLRLFEQLGFEHWGFFPRIARLEGVERDLVVVGLHVPVGS